MASCIKDVSEAVIAYNSGETNFVRLAAKATGFDGWARETGDRANQLNANMDTVFSNAPSQQRFPAAVDVGWTSVSNAANVMAVGQAARGISAFTRSGTGGLSYKILGTETNRAFDVGDELYRVYGDKSPIDGLWTFTKKPGNQISAIRGGALPPNNGTTLLTKITFSGPVQTEASTASKLFGMPGGYTQIRLPPSTNVIYGTGSRLPVGFMPFVPPQFGQYLRRLFK